jgi:hypothetical protein
VARSLPPINAEAQMWAAIERSRVARERALATVSPRAVAGLSAMHRAYPYMPADAKLALAKAGRPPNDPVVGVIAAGAMKRKVKRGFGWHSFGDVISAGGGLLGGAANIAGSGIGFVGERATSIARPVIRTGFMGLQALVEEPAGLLRNIATGLPGQLGEATAGAGGGAAAGAAIGGALGAIGGPLAAVTAGAGALVGGAIGGIAGALGPEAEGKPEWGPSSSLGIAATQLARGERVEAGTGFFVGSKTELYEKQRERALRQARIAGTDQGWTAGRGIVDLVTEPGTAPYNILSGVIDGAIAIKFDPSALALAKGARINAARKTILPERVREVLDTGSGMILKQTLADETSATAIRSMFNGQLDSRPDLLKRLRDTTDVDEIDDILAAPDVLGATVRNKPTNMTDWRHTRVIRRSATRLTTSEEGLKRRQLVNVPRGAINWSDPADAMNKLDAYMAIGRVGKAERLRVNESFIDALATGNPVDRLEPLEAASQAVEEVIKIKLGAGKAQALIDEARSGLVVHSADVIDEAQRTVSSATEIGREVTRLFKSTQTEARNYSAMAVAEGSDIPGVMVQGDRMGLTSPHLMSEFLSSETWLPDMDEVARLTGFLARARNNDLAKGTVDLAQAGMSLWRRTVVLRPAYVPRTLGEAMARMAAAEYDSLFRHPVDFVARIIAQKKGQVLSITDDVEPLKAMEEIQGGLNQMSGSAALGDSKIALADRARLTIEDGSTAYFAGWQRHELSHLATDPVAAVIMRETMRAPVGGGPVRTIDEVKAAFWDGNLSGFRRDLARYVDDDAGTVLADRASADSYIDSITERLNQFTRNDPDIIDYAIAYGRNKAADPKAARAAMERLVAEGNAPKMVVGQRFGGQLAKDQKNLFDKTTDALFDGIAVKPENFFVRHQILGQGYWNSIERMLPALDEAGKERTLEIARGMAKGSLRGGRAMPAEQLARLEARAKLPNPGATLTRDDVHTIAANEAVVATKKLLYDFSSKKQWGSATRLIFPFADVWAEMLRTWSRVVVANPTVLRRGQQVVQGARGSGFFRTDDNGEEVFTYPGSAFVSKLLVGAPIPLTANASSLNLFSSNPVMPGFGPLVQIGAAALLPDKPEYDWLAETISPFGKFGEDTGVVGALLPPWARRLKQAMTSGDSDRLFNNTVYDMAAYLVNSKGYSTATVEDQEVTTDAAISMAKRMYLLRMVSQATLPAAPQPEAITSEEDPDGPYRYYTQRQLGDEFRKLQDEDYDSAPQRFLELYGEDSLLFMQGKSRGGAHPSEETMDWARSHKSTVRSFEDTYGFFAPAGVDFSYTAYTRQLREGEREALKPKEAMQLANARVAQMRLRTAKDAIGPKPTQAQREWLTTYTQALVAQYEGFNPQSFDPGKTPKLMRELERAVTDPVLSKTPVGQALAKYMAARAQATETSRIRLNLTSAVPFAKAKKAAPVRNWLRQVADAIMEETPEFAEIWDRVLSRELTTEDLEEQPAPVVPA